ncbi:MAG: RNA polymerase sigma factor [Saprospiraceae bacterium]|nr:RNA polymerase sigma factor [Saprospiraceae bacterium]
MTEPQLIEQCLKHDRLAQRLLYDRYKNAMYTLAFRITGNFEVASEVLQDAFLQVFKHLSDFQGRSTLGAWIKTIVIRTALSSVRAQKAIFEPLETKHDSTHLDWGLQEIDAHYLEQAIQSLSDGYRAVFVMAEVEGFSHKEIAETLGISEGTSKSQLFYAKKRLREILVPNL